MVSEKDEELSNIVFSDIKEMFKELFADKKKRIELIFELKKALLEKEQKIDELETIIARNLFGYNVN